jgi:hypothetical protein
MQDRPDLGTKVAVTNAIKRGHTRTGHAVRVAYSFAIGHPS